MLSDTDIFQAIEDGDLVIEPFADDLVKPTSVSFHLDGTILRPKPGVIDVKKGTLPDYEEIAITDGRPYSLKPDEFVLGATYEKITLSNKLSMLVQGRSTLGRFGLEVVQTAMAVEAGIRKKGITLELKNNGPNEILLYPRMRIGKGVLFRLDTPASKNYDDYGKYRDQKAVGQPLLGNEFRQAQ